MITISSTPEAEGEPRVALTPETTKEFKSLGAGAEIAGSATEASDTLVGSYQGI